jgi:hypothetical protein
MLAELKYKIGGAKNPKVAPIVSTEAEHENV